MRTRVKICGITRIEDAMQVVKSGADAIGLIFYPKSPRHITVTQAVEIAQQVPAFVTIVALFVNADPTFIREVIHAVKPTLLQFHGDETPEACAQYSLPYIKAIRVKPDTNLVQYAVNFKDAKALLLDAYAENMVGGTGHAFDWNLIPSGLTKPVILAGGLNAHNVRDAISQTKPFAVDVSGGVELDKGIKCPQKIADFMQQVMLANQDIASKN